jgi:murein DD-endopeptidase MepM/ murein hydrolase activator NlpD
VGHKKRKIKYYNFLLIPDNERSTKSLKIKANVLRIFIVFLVVVIILALIGAGTYWKVAEVALRYDDLLDENNQLKEGMARLEELEGDLNKLKTMDQKLRTSLTGYVSLAGSDQTEGGDDLMADLDKIGEEVYDRSIFRFIPDVYPVDGFVTRGFESGSIISDAHLGIDIASAKGSPVKATADGVVLFSGWTYEEGNVVILQHKLNYYSFYKHNLQNLCIELDYVKKGQIIALLGDTGQISSGPHLHFEIWKGLKPINPARLLRSN